VLGAALAVLAVAAVLWAFVFYDAGPAPDYALHSGLLFRLELAVAALVLIAIPGVLIGHLLAGQLPKSVGKDGIDFGDYARAEHDRVDELSEATAQLTRVLEGLVERDAARQRQLEQAIRRLEALESGG
jgi:hypothetical protein